MKKQLFCLVFAIASFSAFAQWSTNPFENNLLTPSDGGVYDTEVEINDDGVTYVFYSKPGPGAMVIYYLQILDKEGNALYPQGKLISDYNNDTATHTNNFLSLDREGNAIYITEDCRYSVANQFAYTAYKISPTGEMLWGNEGVALSDATYSGTACINVVTIDDNSSIFAWSIYDGEIIMNRLSADGEWLWDAPMVLGETNVDYDYPYLVDAGNNQAILLYAKGTNQDLMLRKIDFDGEPVWPEDVKIYRGGFGSGPGSGLINTLLHIIPDGEGGAFIGWHDDRYFTNYESVFVSRILADGSYGFVSGEGGEQLSFSSNLGLRSGQPKLVHDKANNLLYVVWQEFDAQTQGWCRVMAQKLDMQGQFLWDMEGKEIVPLENRVLSYHSAQLGKDGQFAVFYMIYYEWTDQRAYAILLDGKEATELWNEHLDISTNYCNKASLESTPLIDGKYWFTYWSDSRNAETSFDAVVYGQRIFIDGTFDGSTVAIPTIAKENSFAVYPSAIDKQATFVFDNKTSGKVNINLYSLTGQKAADVYNGTLSAGNHSIDWNAKGLCSGTYIAVVQTEAGRFSQKVMVR